MSVSAFRAQPLFPKWNLSISHLAQIATNIDLIDRNPCHCCDSSNLRLPIVQETPGPRLTHSTQNMLVI